MALFILGTGILDSSWTLQFGTHPHKLIWYLFRYDTIPQSAKSPKAPISWQYPHTFQERVLQFQNQQHQTPKPIKKTSNPRKEMSHVIDSPTTNNDTVRL